jgi:hypothetical protein
MLSAFTGGMRRAWAAGSKPSIPKNERRVRDMAKIWMKNGKGRKFILF